MNEVKNLIDRAERAITSSKVLFMEKDYDTSASRSYYAMFYAAQALLLSKELKFSSHKSVISLFGEHFIKTGIFRSDMGRILNRAFEKRLLGDYSFSPQIDETMAKEMISKAEEFVKEIKKYLNIQA
jgi:uncharacterized protein (UPF0332 family)